MRPPLWAFLVLGLAVVAYKTFDGRMLSDRPSVSTGDSVTGTTSVVDGDTIEIHGRRIRLWGIDAPESTQTCKIAGRPWRIGQRAALALSDQIKYRVVTCQHRDTDRYGRMVAACTVSGRDLAGWLVSEGWALDYPQYSDGAYQEQQARAKLRRRGMWQCEFVLPWEWRRQRHSGLLEDRTRPLRFLNPYLAEIEHRRL